MIYAKFLKHQWDLLWLTFNINNKTKDELFQELLNCYSQGGRYYHNLTHIQFMLIQIKKMQSLAINLNSILIATWFHDSIYDPRALDNEGKSAQYAVKKLNDLNLEENLINSVEKLILITKHDNSLIHRINIPIDEQILLDGDLAILGTSPRKYNNYALAIRQEYAWVSPQEYSQKRKELLKTFLAKERIYFTPILFEKLENKARFNIQQEINNL
jgi:predicted metal-dependent HD superfamily phosphohydrolase